VSLPCVPAGSGSVADVFGDDIADAFGAVSPTYETSWVVYKYDLSTSGGYIKLHYCPVKHLRALKAVV